ncbi:MAG: hypothetical protein RJA57_1536 [Bacteroidota bacterium]
MHPTHLRTQVAPADILITLPGCQYGLDPHHPFALHLPVGTIAVEYEPMPAVELNGKWIVILQGDAVGEHVVRLQRIAVIGLEKGFHAHFYPLGNQADHRVKVVKNDIPLIRWD